MSKREFLLYLFDLDRTLINTHEYIEACVSHTIRVHDGIDRRTHKNYGLTLRGFYQAVNPDGDVESYIRTHMDFQKKNLHLAKLFPNTLSVLRELRSRRKMCGLVTSRHRNSVVELKKFLGLEGFFLHEATIDCVQLPKPHPEGILQGISLLQGWGATRENTVMVGDSNEDLLAAVHAEVTSVWTSEGVHPDEPKPVTVPTHEIYDIGQVLEL